MLSTIRIIGTPPPLGVPLELTGKILLGPGRNDTRMFAALSVIRGRKMRQPRPQQPSNAPPPAPARATEAECDKPPYGGTEADYQTFARAYGRIITPARILSGVCKAKFGQASRDGLHKLGFSDGKIQSESTEQLAGETIVALKKLVKTIE